MIPRERLLTTITRSLRESRVNALDDLGLERIFVVYPGELCFPLHEKIEAVGYAQITGFRLP
jgi:hypothetical protein